MPPRDGEHGDRRPSRSVADDDARPFVWTATAEEILEKVRRGRVALTAITSDKRDITLGGVAGLYRHHRP